MTNLLAETLQNIVWSEHTPDDIVFIGSRSSGHRCTWGEFTKIADIEYDNGYGGQQVAADLEIHFSDGAWLARGEYDGSEWWETHTPLVIPAESHPITRLVGGGSWRGLAEVNDPDSDYN